MVNWTLKERRLQEIETEQRINRNEAEWRKTSVDLGIEDLQ